MEPLDSVSQTGFALFRQIGCARCHRAFLETRSRFLPLAHPEVAEDPMANVYTAIDLVEVGFSPSPNGGVFVPLFADLKRHAMGEVLMESFHGDAIANDEFTTARLWGIADTGPYLHDGRALSLSEAIAAHGGEAEMARDAFLGLTQLGQETLVAFLNKLRTPIVPNMELLAGP